MTNIEWPETLPIPMISGLEGKYNKSFVRTEMDSGPAKQRRRFTAITKNVSGKIIVTEEQREALEYFFNNTISCGTLRFKMKDPQSGLLAEFRFTDTYTEAGNDGGRWEISLPLERMG